MAAAGRSGVHTRAMSSPFVLISAAVFGSIIGSFLNVCIHRLPRHESIVRPRSRCPACGSPLKWLDNIPVVSWLALGARCRECQEPISVRYPMVEILAAVTAVAIVWSTPPSALLISRLVLAALLIVLLFIDFEHHILPNVITIPGIVIGFGFSLIAPPGPVQSLLGMLVGALTLIVVGGSYYLVRRVEGLGMGDVKMLAMIGAFLGWQAVILTLVLSSFLGAIIGIALLVTRQADMGHALPFGTFLAIAALVSMLAGDGIIRWYFGWL